MANFASTEYPRGKTIIELFEEVAVRRREAVAVAFGDEQVSYEELNRRANRIGSYLRSAGIGPEVMVGICMERSLEMVAGIVGILKAGGVYVPLDPGYPQERLRWVVEDAGVGVVLTQRSLQERLAEGARASASTWSKTPAQYAAQVRELVGRVAGV